MGMDNGVPGPGQYFDDQELHQVIERVVMILLILFHPSRLMHEIAGLFEESSILER